MSYVKIKIELSNSGDEPLHGKDISESKEDLATISYNFDSLETVPNKNKMLIIETLDLGLMIIFKVEKVLQ